MNKSCCVMRCDPMNRSKLPIPLLVFLILFLICSSFLSSSQTCQLWKKIVDKAIDNQKVPQMFPITGFKGSLFFMIPPTGGKIAVAVQIWRYDGTAFKKTAPNGFCDRSNIAFSRLCL